VRDNTTRSKARLVKYCTGSWGSQWWRVSAIITGLTLLFLVDLVIPLPILGAVLLAVAITRPPWFIRMVRELYGERG